MTTPPDDALKMTEAQYRDSKFQMTRWDKKPTQPVAAFDKARLAKEIADFEASGAVSPFSSTSNTSAPPQPKAAPTGSPSATDLTDEQWRRARKEIQAGRVPALNAKDTIHA